MKKIFISLLAVAALAACTKSEVAYEAPAEIGFNIVAGNMTKAAVDGTTFPTNLNMYIYANTIGNTTSADADYFAKAEFTCLGAYNSINTGSSDTKAVWGGGSSSSNRNPYYWPNVNKLHFAGFSKSGNVKDATVAYDCAANTLSITGYTPTGNDNDLMWFPSTEFANSSGYGKNTTYVPVTMYHACAWITFLVQGDAVTGKSGSTYKVTSMNIAKLDQTADVVCTGSNPITTGSMVWTNNEGTGTPLVKTDNLGSFLYTGGVSIANTVTVNGSETTTSNVETAAAGYTSGNIIVIPQLPGVLELTYTYTSPANKTVTDVYSVASNNALSLSLGENVKWEPGKHYVYTITIGANEILIAPTANEWTPDTNHGVTVQ